MDKAATWADDHRSEPCRGRWIRRSPNRTGPHIALSRSRLHLHRGHPTLKPIRPTISPAGRLRPKLVVAALVAALAAPTTVPAQVNLPSLGDSASEDLALGNERRLGEQIMQDIWRDPAYLEEPVLDDYLQQLWQPLVDAARRRGDIGTEAGERLAWTPFLVRDRSVNAFALPGGYIGVHLGLISLTSSRDELASVMAHELSHITQRHIARSISNSQRQSLIGLAAIILGVLAASRTNASGDAVSAVVAGGQAAAIQGQLNFSRDMEREADRVGYAVLTQAGYAPSGMASMFEKLDSAFRLNDGNNFPYLRTHPLTTERIGEARSRLASAPPDPPPASRLEHAVMQGRARGLMDLRSETLQRLQAVDRRQDADGAAVPLPERLTALVASAIASNVLRDRERAAAAAASALGLVRGSPMSDARAERAVRLLQAQLAIDRGDAAAAQSALEPYRADRARALVVLRAQAALVGERPDAARLRESAEELQTLVAVHPTDAQAWSTLAQIDDRLGRPLRSLRAQAESHAAHGDLTGAVDRLRAGQRRAREPGQADFIEASVIEARLREIEAQRRQLAIDLYGADRNGEPRQPPQ